MGVWHERVFTYKAGFMGIVCGVLMFVVGFCAPSWAEFDMPLAPHQTQSMGLWQVCTGDLSVCAMSVDTDSPGWLKAVRALESISMFFAVAACVVGLYCNCMLKAQFSSDFFNKNMETAAIVSVVFGTFGLIIFATQVQTYYSDRVGHVSWGFIVVCISNAVLGVSAFLMLIARRLHIMSLENHFAHRRFVNSFHTNGNLPPEYSVDTGNHLFIADPDGTINFGPPAYETVVNCIPQDEAPPPPYAHVVKSNE